MAIILKDKNGNQLNRIKNYSATDSQVQKAIDTRIADGTINIDIKNQNVKVRNMLIPYYKTATNCLNSANGVSNQRGYFYKIEGGKKYVSNSTLIQGNGLSNLQFFDKDDNIICSSYDVDLTTLEYTEVKNGEYTITYVSFIAPLNATYVVQINSERTLCLFDDFIGIGKFPISNDIELNLDSNKYYIVDNILMKNLINMQNKTILCFGDSYTNYLAKEGGYFAGLGQSFGANVKNYGIASSTIKNNSEGGSSYQPMVDRVDTLISENESDADNIALITFMGGTNDSWGKTSSLGENIYDMSKGHIYGACHYIFRRLKEAFPNAKILVILQPSCANYKISDITDEEVVKSLGFTDLANAQQFTDLQLSVLKSQTKQNIVDEVAKFYSLDVLDCCRNWYSPLNSNELSTYWDTDYLHLTSAGNEDLTNRTRLKLYELYN